MMDIRFKHQEADHILFGGGHVSDVEEVLLDLLGLIVEHSARECDDSPASRELFGLDGDTPCNYVVDAHHFLPLDCSRLAFALLAGFILAPMMPAFFAFLGDGAIIAK